MKSCSPYGRIYSRNGLLWSRALKTLRDTFRYLLVSPVLLSPLYLNSTYLSCISLKTVEDMKQLVTHPFPRTTDSATDLRAAQNLLESKRELYGNALLTQNGLEWKVMAMPEQDHLIAATKGWFYSLALALLGEVNMDVAKHRSQGIEEGHEGWREKEAGKVSVCVVFIYF